MRLRKPDTSEGTLEMVADELPDGNRVELLRSIGGPGLKLGGDTHQRLLGLAEVGMQPRQGDRRLPGVFRSTPDRGHQPRPAGNRLAAGFWMGQPDEQAPPVVDQRHRSGRELAAVQIVRREATPAPLVFQFIEGVLGISPIPVQLP